MSCKPFVFEISNFEDLCNRLAAPSQEFGDKLRKLGLLPKFALIFTGDGKIVPVSVSDSRLEPLEFPLEKITLEEVDSISLFKFSASPGSCGLSGNGGGVKCSPCD